MYDAGRYAKGQSSHEGMCERRGDRGYVPVPVERILAKAAAGDVPPEIAAQPHYAGGVQVAEPPP